MKRREFLKLIGAATIFSACSVESTAARPNVLLVSLDDLNDWVSCLGGHPDAQTPNIDRLAARGLLFRDAHCASPKCNPSRTAIFTGLMPSTTGIYDNGHWWKPHLPDVVTMPDYFRGHGYLTAGGGKIFHHTAGFNPPDQWDEYFDLRFDDPWDRNTSAYPGTPQVDPPERHPLNGIQPFRHEFDWGPLPIEDDQYGDSKTVRWASDFLGREHQKPFLLAVGLFHPHLPWYAPDQHFAAHPEEDTELPEIPEDDLDDIPPIGLELAASGRIGLDAVRKLGKHKEAVAAYLANIRFADELVGRLLDDLDASAYGDNTVIAMFSDHGFHLGEKQHWFKSTLWDRATHVPFAVVAPGVTQPATTSDAPVTLIDLFPTLLELSGLPPKGDLDGQSLVSLLRGDPSVEQRPALVTFLRGNHAVKTREWSYIRYSDGGEELYDRVADPGEFVNLSDGGEFDDIKQQLSARMPKLEAPDAPTKSAYEFDFEKYQWTPK